MLCPEQVCRPAGDIFPHGFVPATICCSTGAPEQSTMVIPELSIQGKEMQGFQWQKLKDLAKFQPTYPFCPQIIDYSELKEIHRDHPSPVLPDLCLFLYSVLKEAHFCLSVSREGSLDVSHHQDVQH